MKNLELLVTIFIYTHAIAGGIAMVLGFLVVILSKGNRLHKRLGIVFFYSMLYATLSSLIIAVLPGHTSPFLFSIGIFTGYLLIGGKRSLKYRNPKTTLAPDYFLSTIMVIASVGMVMLPWMIYGRINVVLSIFGLVSGALSLRDFYLFQNRQLLQAKWLQLHIIKIMGSFIASVSAFMVVNQSLPGVWNWFSAGLVGGLYIMYWLMKIEHKKKMVHIA